MADEQAKPPFNKPSPIPKGFGWDVLMKLDIVLGMRPARRRTEAGGRKY